MDIVLHGNMQPFEMKRLAEQVKEKLLTSPYVTQVDLKGAPAEEVHVEISALALEQYGLTLANVAALIRENAVEKSAGTVKTQSGDILVTLNNRSYWAKEFAMLPLITDKSGVVLTLGEVASIKEGFADTADIVLSLIHI